MSFRGYHAWAVAGIVWHGGVQCAVTAAEPAAPPPRIGYFEKIKPLLAVHCHKCHGAETQKNGLRLDQSQPAMAGGESGLPAIVPGHSAQSELIRRVTSADPDERMPPKSPRLTAPEIELMRQWIDDGASWPARDEYWAFLPPRDSALPAVADEAPGVAINPIIPINPIDRFITARLEAAKLAPAPSADSRTLLRRAFAVLLGLPPSLDEAERFFSDRSPRAWENLIDRLLADPRYGERWARHWLDLVRYGESDGYEDDKIRPHAWRYRDYVIRSFNADKPYDQFVQEQIAGDELWPGDPDSWIATGFARLGAWDGMSKEPAQQRQDFLNDATDAVGSVFLGITIGCARCHDHKYDPVSQRDYYRLQAFFAGVKRESRELKGDPLHDSPAVLAIYRQDGAELENLTTEREELLLRGRQELEREQKGAAGEAGKIDDAAVKKKVEALRPGRLGELAGQTRALETRRKLHAPAADVVCHDASAVLATRILKGGELARPGPLVEPGVIELMVTAGMTPEVPADRLSGRRTILARWLALPDHPLTARVMVNRLWQHHFGAGIVATPSDFGRNGRPPTHPELLDWLARQFVREGFSLKTMHRLIMTSAAWRRSASAILAAMEIDPENRLLWRMNRRRLESEAIRDTLLAVSGMLNPEMGGPGIYAPLPAGVTVELPNNDKELSWGTASEADSRRRSIYLFQRRSLTFPLMEVFDAPAMSQSCPVRPETTVASQALALFNGEFCRTAAGRFAERLRREAGDEPGAQIDRAYRIAFARQPAEHEKATASDFLRDQTVCRHGDAAAALVDFCHAILNASELIHID